MKSELPPIVVWPGLAQNDTEARLDWQGYFLPERPCDVQKTITFGCVVGEESAHEMHCLNLRKRPRKRCGISELQPDSSQSTVAECRKVLRGPTPSTSAILAATSITLIRLRGPTARPTKSQVLVVATPMSARGNTNACPSTAAVDR